MAGAAAQADIRMDSRNQVMKGLSKEHELYPEAPVESSKSIKQVDMIKLEIWTEHSDRIRGQGNL